LLSFAAGCLAGRADRIKFHISQWPVHAVLLLRADVGRDEKTEKTEKTLKSFKSFKISIVKSLNQL
jgi:hypothetical protein